MAKKVIVINGKKYCSVCNELKDLSSFGKDKQHITGHKSACSVCQYERWKVWRDANLEEQRRKDRIYHYVRKYNLPQEKAEMLVENRVGSCTICGNIAPLVVDHCHTTDKVRGLICSPCNSLLGYSKDNTKTLQNAIKYLKEFYGEDVDV